MENEMSYKLSDFFMVRHPLLPIEDYEKLDKADNLYESIIEIFESNSYIREAILISSKSLYESLKYKNGDKDKIINSFLKYYIRMTTRTTPFGLLCGVTIGSFGETDTIKLEAEKFKKRARPDAEWICKIIKVLEGQPDILNYLTIKSSKTLLDKGARLENKVPTGYGSSEEKKSSCSSLTINNSQVVKAVLEAAENGIEFKELMDKLVKAMPNVTENKIYNFIKGLIEKEYLITNLRPKITSVNMLQDILDRCSMQLNQSRDLLDKLSHINNLINDYNSTSIGNGEAVVLEIYEKMKELSVNKNYLQVDSKISEESYIINTELKKSIEGIIPVLEILSSARTKSVALDDYIYKFNERYSQGQEVPLLELVDEDRGIGYPAGYHNSKNRILSMQSNANENAEQIKHFMKAKLTSNEARGKREVIITTDELLSLGLKKPETKDLMHSLEMNFLVVKESKDYKLVLGPNVGSFKTGKMFGRFMNLFNENKQKLVAKEILSSNDLFDKDILHSTIAEMPPSTRMLNVTNSLNFLEYELPIGLTSSKDDEHTLNLEDLLVGCNNNKLYIRSKKFCKIVNFSTHNMLNPLHLNNMTRLLLEISEDCQSLEIFIILNDVISSMVYTPRVSFNDIIVIPERWYVNDDLLGVKIKKNNRALFYEVFVNWRNNNNLRDYVYLSKGDHKILLNLNNKVHMDLIFDEYIRANPKQVILEEYIGDTLEEHGLELENKCHATEIVIPFVRAFKDTEIKGDITNIPIKSISQYDDARVYLPFDDWLYLKLYVDKYRQEEFLSGELDSLISFLYTNNFIKKSFFIRYYDDKDHIRVRFLINPEKKMEFYECIKEFIKKVYSVKIVNNVSVDTYIREIERYGGIDLIDKAESLFSKDSEVVINLLKYQKIQKSDLDIKDIGVINLIKYMYDLNLNHKEQLALLDTFINKDEYRTEFKNKRKKLMKYCDKRNNWENIRMVDSEQELFKILSIRTEKANEYAALLDGIRLQYKSENKKNDIVLSIMHMFCNRFYGIDRRLEREILAYTRHTLYSLSHVYK